MYTNAHKDEFTGTLAIETKQCYRYQPHHLPSIVSGICLSHATVGVVSVWTRQLRNIWR